MSNKTVESVLRSGIRIDEAARTIHVNDHLSAKLWQQVRGVMIAMGGEWVSQDQAFAFAKPPRALVERVLSAGARVINRFHLYPTTQAVWVEIESNTPLEYFGLTFDRPIRVLEPSVGTGALVGYLHDLGHRTGREFDVDCYEIDPLNVLLCEEAGIPVTQADFLTVAPRAEYDIALLNPPFSGETFIKHIQHAQKFLRPGGVLISVAPTDWATNPSKSAACTTIYEKALVNSEEFMNTGGFFEVGTFPGVSCETTLIVLDSLEIEQRYLSSEVAFNRSSFALEMKITQEEAFNDRWRAIEDNVAEHGLDDDTAGALIDLVSEAIASAPGSDLHIFPLHHKRLVSEALKSVGGLSAAVPVREAPSQQMAMF